MSERLLAEVEQHLEQAGLTLLSQSQLEQRWPERDAAELALALRALRAQQRAVRVSGLLYAHPSAVVDVERRMRQLIEADGYVTLARARDALAVGRKATQALLEHLDGARVTRRLDDNRRVLVR